MIFDKGVKTTRWGKDTLSTNGIGKIGYPHTKNEGGPYLTPYMKIINSK